MRTTIEQRRAMLAYMVEHPEATSKQIAAHFGVKERAVAHAKQYGVGSCRQRAASAGYFEAVIEQARKYRDRTLAAASALSREGFVLAE